MNEQWLLWCGFNAEQESLCQHLTEENISFVSVDGSLSFDEKERRVELWMSGQVQVMISKPSVLGFGMNFQHCHNMAFVGIGDSFESYYQCIRRCYRFGQNHPVNAYIVISEIEQEIFANVMRKEKEVTTMSEKLIEHVKQFEQKELEHHKEDYRYNNATIMQLPAWLLVA